MNPPDHFRVPRPFYRLKTKSKLLGLLETNFAKRKLRIRIEVYPVTVKFKYLIFRNDMNHLVDLCVSHQLLGRVVCIKTIATKDLDGISGGLVGNVAGKALCNGGV